MTPQEIQFIVQCLSKRVVPRDAEEGAAIISLARKLAQHHAPKPVAVPEQKVDER